MPPIRDVVVVGAGPAGLSCAAEVAAHGGRCLVVEQGASDADRDRYAPEDVLAGLGGAGLFSDGKHSFFPAATALWTLPDRAALAGAYERTRELLARRGLEAPPFPMGDRAPDEPLGAWSLKRYPAIYASFEDRRRVIADLHRACGEAWLSSRVIGAARTERGTIAVDVLRGAERQIVETRRLVVATGRLSPRWIRSWLEPLGARFDHRRLEIGVRLETAASSPPFTTLDAVDPKLSLVEPDGTRLLTFCTCRDGEVVLGSIGGMRSFSGRADGPRTGRSSVGLLARVTDRALARSIEPYVFGLHPPWSAPLAELLPAPSRDARMRATFGLAGAEVVGRAIVRFVEQFPELAVHGATVHSPCIEGVGEYPASGPHLEVAPSVFVAGDVCGRFRGIVASMVSGRYVGGRLSRPDVIV